jgi:hypothetical protein
MNILATFLISFLSLLLLFGGLIYDSMRKLEVISTSSYNPILFLYYLGKFELSIRSNSIFETFITLNYLYYNYNIYSEDIKLAQELLNELGFSTSYKNGCLDASTTIAIRSFQILYDFYPDGIVVAFDTYCGESFVSDVAKKATKAALGMDNVGDISCSVVDEVKEIPGVGFVSSSTDDPVIIASIENTSDVGVVAGSIIGAVLGYQNTYLVSRNTPCNVIPGSVIFSVSAIMNCNIIDLSHSFVHRCRLLEK